MNLKMKPAERQKLAAQVLPMDIEPRRDHYRKGLHVNAAATQDLNKRYRWDLWWDVPWNVREEILDTMTQQYGEYPKDAWIDSALRLIVPQL